MFRPDPESEIEGLARKAWTFNACSNEATMPAMAKNCHRPAHRQRAANGLFLSNTTSRTTKEQPVQFKKSFAIAAFSAYLLGACSSTELNQPTQQAAPAATAQQSATASDPRDVKTVDTTSKGLTDQDAGLAGRSVYFDYDSYLLRSDAAPLLQAHAKYLERNKGKTILIQGNTDERGGSEYNLALGQKRAESVRKALAVLGVAGDRMEAVSLGKEKPKALGNTEAAWAENRRADIVYR